MNCFAFWGMPITIILIILPIIETVIFFVIWKRIDIQNNRIRLYKSNSLYNIFSFVCLMVAILSFILNFGWLRLIVLITGVPLIMLIIHYLMFFMVNKDYSRFVNCSKKLAIINKLVYVTYILIWLLFPDCDCIGPAIIFFRVIKIDCDITWLMVLSVLLIVLNFILLIIQFIGTAKIKERIQEEQTII